MLLVTSSMGSRADGNQVATPETKMIRWMPTPNHPRAMQIPIRAIGTSQGGSRLLVPANLLFPPAVPNPGKSLAGQVF